MKLGIKALFESLFRRFGEDSTEDQTKDQTADSTKNDQPEDPHKEAIIRTQLWTQFLRVLENILFDVNSDRPEISESNLKDKGLELKDVRNSNNFQLWLKANPNFVNELNNTLFADYKESKLQFDTHLGTFTDGEELQQLITRSIDHYIQFLEKKKNLFKKELGQNKARVTNELKENLVEIIMEKFDQFFREDYKKDNFFKDLDENLIKVLRIELQDMIKKDLDSTLINQIAQDIVGVDRTQVQDFLNEEATKLFEEHYKPKLEQRSIDMIIRIKDPEKVEDIISGEKIVNLQEEFQKIAKRQLDKKQDYFYIVGEDLYFTDLGKTTFLTLWRAHLKTNAESIVNLFLAQIKAVSAEEHKETLEKENFKYHMAALSEDMQKLASVNDKYKAFFGTESVPLLEFLIERNLDKWSNVDKFNIEVPGYFGRDTTILHAMNRMTKRNLFYPMAPDLKSEKWTLTINPILKYDKIASLYAGSLATEFRDILTVFAYRGALDENDPFHPLWVLIRNVMLAFDKYAFAHLEPGNLEKLVQTGGKVVDVTKQTLENVSSKNPIGNPTENQPEAKPEQAASGTEQNVEPPEKTGIYSLHRFLKLAADVSEDDEIYVLVSQLFKKFHGNASEGKNPLKIDYTEYASDTLPWKVIELKIPYTFFRKINLIKNVNILDILQGKNLKDFPQLVNNKYIVGYEYLYNNEGSSDNKFLVAIPNKNYKKMLKNVLTQKYPNKTEEIENIKSTDMLDWLGKLAEIFRKQVNDIIKEVKLPPLIQDIIKRVDFTKVQPIRIVQYAKELNLSLNEIGSIIRDPAKLQKFREELNQEVKSNLPKPLIKSSGEIDYNIFIGKKRESKDVKLIREINTIIRQIEIKYGVTPDNSFPAHLVQELINVVDNIRNSFQGISLFSVGAIKFEFNKLESVTETIKKLPIDDISLGDIAILYDSFIEFRNRTAQILSEGGDIRIGENTQIVRNIDSILHNTAPIFVNESVKNPDIKILLKLGSLENILNGLYYYSYMYTPDKYREIRNKIDTIISDLDLPTIKDDELEKLPSAEVLEKMLQELANSPIVQEKQKQSQEGIIDIDMLPKHIDLEAYDINAKFLLFDENIKERFSINIDVSNQTIDENKLYEELVQILNTASEKGVPVDIVTDKPSQTEEMLRQEKPFSFDNISFGTPEELLDKINKTIQIFQNDPNVNLETINKLNTLKDRLLKTKMLKGAKNDNEEQPINEIKKIEKEFKESLINLFRSQGLPLNISSNAYLAYLIGNTPIDSDTANKLIKNLRNKLKTLFSDLQKLEFNTNFPDREKKLIAISNSFLKELIESPNEQEAQEAITNKYETSISEFLNRAKTINDIRQHSLELFLKDKEPEISKLPEKAKNELNQIKDKAKTEFNFLCDQYVRNLDRIIGDEEPISRMIEYVNQGEYILGEAGEAISDLINKYLK
jgi:phosphoglycolate phosphatase-like HAD superfamily hydrolase